MGTWLQYVQTVAAGLLIGKVLLLSLVVAPVLAKQLEPAAFGRVVRRLFPAYYALGMGAACLGLAAGLGRTLVDPARATGSAGILLGMWGGVLALEWYSRARMTPRLNELRDALAETPSPPLQMGPQRRAWDRLHRRAVQINGVVLLAGFVILGIA